MLRCWKVTCPEKLQTVPKIAVLSTREAGFLRSLSLVAPSPSRLSSVSNSEHVLGHQSRVNTDDLDSTPRHSPDQSPVGQCPGPAGLAVFLIGLLDRLYSNECHC